MSDTTDLKMLRALRDDIEELRKRALRLAERGVASHLTNAHRAAVFAVRHETVWSEGGER